MASKPRIIYIHPIFIPYGGAEKVLIELFQRTKKDFECHMYTLFYADYLKNEKNLHYASKTPPALHKIFGYKANPFNGKYIKKLGAVLAKNYRENDIIMFTNFPGSLILHEAIKINPEIKKGRNIFFSFEPDRILHFNKLKKTRYLPEDLNTIKFKVATNFFWNWRKLDNYVINNETSEIFTLSDYVSRQTIAVFDKTNAKTRKATELYVDLSKFKFKSKQESREKLENHYKLGLKKEDIVVLSQARVERSKGILELVEAVKQINKEKSCPKIKLLIGGKGNLFEMVKKESEKEGNIFMLGFIPNDLLHHLYASADIFVTLPRKETGGPLTILEGMYAEAIVIGTDEAGPPELIENGKTGFLADARNIKDIAKKIKTAYNLRESNNENYKNIIRKAREKVVKMYTFEKFYERLITNLTR
ncbi:glycosyltransferase family 4 protein [Candidatus Woesearchaeota archaeon]|nr:glycosyltransferase family 4 protein [Candidatus Woesearchaeota archaeon]